MSRDKLRLSKSSSRPYELARVTTTRDEPTTIAAPLETLPRIAPVIVPPVNPIAICCPKKDSYHFYAALGNK